MELCVILTGGKIGYSTGSPLRIIEDMQVLGPNFFPAVPRLLNRIYQLIAANLEAPGLKGALFRRGVAAKMERLKATGDYSHPFWDRLVFNKVILHLYPRRHHFDKRVWVGSGCSRRKRCARYIRFSSIKSAGPRFPARCPLLRYLTRSVVWPLS